VNRYGIVHSLSPASQATMAVKPKLNLCPDGFVTGLVKLFLLTKPLAWNYGSIIGGMVSKGLRASFLSGYPEASGKWATTL